MRKLTNISHHKISKYIVETELGSQNKRHILYSLRSNKLLIVKPELYNKFKQVEEKGMTEEELNSFIGGQFLVPEETEELKEILHENKSLYQNENYLYYVIQPTANCNFGCDYCGQEHLDYSMSEITIENTIRRIRSKLIESKKDELQLGWFGGEPLLALDKMRRINDSIKSLLKDLNIGKYGGQMATNGYLLNLEVYKELVSDFNIDKLEITLDGDKCSHDSRRVDKNSNQSFDEIYSGIKSIVHSEFYLNNIKKCMISIRCNVDERNHCNVSNLLDQMKADGMHERVLFYIAPIRDWGGNNANVKSLSLKEFNQLILDLNIKMLDLGFFVDSLLPKRNFGVCSAIEGNMEMVDAFGKVWGCSETSLTPKYKDSAFGLGHVNKNDLISDNQIFKDYFSTLIDPKCMSCSLLPVCGAGCPKNMLEGSKQCAYSKTVIKEQMKVQATYNLLKKSNEKA